MRKSTLSFFLLAVPAGLASLQLSLPGEPVSNRILGKRNTELAAILGPPERIIEHQESQTWNWRKGKHRDVTVCAGRVVHVDPTFDPADWQAKPVPAAGAYPGQPVAQLLARMGNPGRLNWVRHSRFGPRPPIPLTSPEPGSSFLVYGKTWVGISEDVVTVVRAPIPPRKQKGPGR